MNEYVCDTHSLFWYLTGSPLLGAKASTAFDEAANGQALIHIPAIVFAELYFVNAKYNQIIDFQNDFNTIKHSAQFVLVPFYAADVLDFNRDSAVKEMHDRIIVGAARRLNAPLLTRDKNITASSLVKIIW